MNKPVTVSDYNNTHLLLGGVPWDAEGIALIRAIPSHHAPVGRDIRFKPSGAAIDYVQATWPGATWTGRAAELRDERLQQHAAHVAMGDEKRSDAVRSFGDYAYKTTPFEHQQRALSLCAGRPYYGLLMEMRTGKSKVVLDDAARLFLLGELKNLVVVALPGIQHVWVEDEVPTHVPDAARPRAFAYRTGGGKERGRAFEGFLRHDGLRVYATAGVSLVSAAARAELEAVVRSGPTMLVVDESTQIKNPSAQRTKYLVKMARDPRVKWRRILIGTPVEQGYEDLFAQYLFLEPGVLGYDTYTAFKARYCHMTAVRENSDQKMITGYLNVPELLAAVDKVSFRVSRAQVFPHLPPKVYQRFPYEMEPRQARLYKEFARFCMAELNGKMMSSEIVLTKFERLRSLAAGWFKADDSKEPEMCDGGHRLQLIRDLVTPWAGREKIIIWSHMPRLLNELQEVLPRGRSVVYHGGVSDSHRRERYERFREDGDCAFFLANQAVAGRGLELSCAGAMLYATNSFRYGDRAQSEDRPFASTQSAARVLIGDQTALGTVESRVLAALKSKEAMATTLAERVEVIFSWGLTG